MSESKRAPGLPLPPPLTSTKQGTFAYFTVTERFPATIRRVIEDNDYPTAIVEALEELMAEIPLGLVRQLHDSGPDLAVWDTYIEPFEGQSWLDVPWFFAELYFYRRLLEATGYFGTGAGGGIDPFGPQKRLGLFSAAESIRGLVTWLDQAADQVGLRTPEVLISLLHYVLWGNRSDLSLWPVGDDGTEHSLVDVAHEQANLLVDDAATVADRLVTLEGARIDIVVDNAGFELVCDLCLVDALLRSGIAGTIHLHLKPYPIFVSDAMPKDVLATCETLRTDAHPAVRGLAQRIVDALEDERLQLEADPFWASPLAFWEVPEALYRELSQADLLFIKGDANYRRLLGDRQWSYSTPFAQICSYVPAPTVALRTLKSEVAAGLDPAQTESAAQQNPNWLTEGQWGVIQLVDPSEPGERKDSVL